MARPRKDVMKPQAVQLGAPVQSEGGMAHSLDTKGDKWGGRQPPFPRSELARKTRGGMTLIKN